MATSVLCVEKEPGHWEFICHDAGLIKRVVAELVARGQGFDGRFSIHTSPGTSAQPAKLLIDQIDETPRMRIHRFVVEAIAAAGGTTLRLITGDHEMLFSGSSVLTRDR